MHPRYRITRNCPKLIWELGLLRHKELGAKTAQNRDQPEAIVDKDNHAWDGLKMFLQRFPPSPSELKSKEKGGSFVWWQEQIKRANHGNEVQSYHRDMVI